MFDIYICSVSLHILYLHFNCPNFFFLEKVIFTIYHDLWMINLFSHLKWTGDRFNFLVMLFRTVCGQVLVLAIWGTLQVTGKGGWFLYIAFASTFMASFFIPFNG